VYIIIVTIKYYDKEMMKKIVQHTGGKRHNLSISSNDSADLNSK